MSTTAIKNWNLTHLISTFNLLLVIRNRSKALWFLWIFFRLFLYFIIAFIFRILIFNQSNSKDNIHLKNWWFFRLVRSFWYNFFLIDDLFWLIELVFELFFNNIWIFNFSAFDLNLCNFLDFKIRESLQLTVETIFSLIEYFESYNLFVQEINRWMSLQSLDFEMWQLDSSFL